MISDNHIFFYFIGLLLVLPVLIGVAYSLLSGLGVEHPLLYAVVGTPLVFWAISWIYSFVDDVNGHLE